MRQAVIGIGTNMGDRLKNISDAEASLNLLPNTKIINKSSIYETKPWGFSDQENFYNSAVLVQTELSPNALLGALLGIEAAIGRVREFKNGPRIIDLDLLLYENEKMNTNELTLPHPRISERAFVLFPLNDLFKDNVAFDFDFSIFIKRIDKIEIIGKII